MDAPWKLISYSNGKLSTIRETVTNLKKKVGSSSMSIPTAFICVTGGTGSGKSFYTNLLINYFQNDCSVNSLTSSSRIPGFSFGNCDSNQLFQVGDNEASGVYVWQNPFFLKNYQGQLILWILHLHLHQEGSDEEQQLLNYLVQLVCSRVITISVENVEKPALKPHFDFLQNSDLNCKIQFQKSIMYICRTNSKPFLILTANPEAIIKSELSQFNSVIKDIEDLPYFKNYKCISFANITNFQTQLHDQLGCLKIDEDIYWQLDQVVKLMGDASLIWPNLYKAKPLDSNCVSSFFRECTRIVSSHQASISKKEIEKQVVKGSTAATIQNPMTAPIPTRRINESSHLVEKNTAPRVVPTDSESGRDINYNSKTNAPISTRNRRSYRNIFGSIGKRNNPEKRFKTLLNIASNEFEQKMHRNYIELLVTNLQESPEKYVSKIFNQSINDAIRSMQIPYNLSEVDVDKLEYSMQRSCVSIYTEYLSKHKLVLQYNTSIFSHVNSYLNYPIDVEANQMLNNAHYSISKKFNIIIKGVVADAREKLRCFYLRQLENIVVTEKLILKETIVKIVASYKTNMNETVCKGYYSSSQFSKIHIKFCNKYTNILELCKRKNDKNIGNINDCIQELKQLLEVEFQVFRERNRLKLTKLHRDVESLMTSQKKLYCDEIEQAIESGVSGRMLEEVHKNLLINLKLGLEAELCTILGIGQSNPLYWKALEFHIINKYWANFQHQPEPKSLVPLNNEPNVDVLPNRNEFLGPIIYHLSLTQIGVSINHNNLIHRILNIPLVVGVTTQGQWVYGNQIKTISQNSFKNILNVGDLLSGKKRSSIEANKVVGEAESLITAEVLLGFLFKGLKQQIEKEFSGKIPNGIVIVPFWFTSYQRQQVVQAGQIASLNETEIISENSAITCYAAQRLKDGNQNHDIFVISENSDVVDATAYSFDIKTGVLKMVGHCSSYEINGISANIEQLVASACKKAISQCKPSSNERTKQKTQLRMVFVSYESSNWSEILCSMRRTIPHAINGDVSGWEADLGTLGATMYFQNESFLLQEWISSPLLFAANSLEYEFFPKRQDFYHPSRGKELLVPTLLPKKTSQARVYQRAFNGKRKTVIGLLSMSRAQSRCKLEVIINHQGIMRFSELIMDNAVDTFTWSATNISEAQVFQHADKIKKIMSDSSRKDLCEENKSQVDLIKKFQDIQSRIARGEGRFQSDMGRQMAIEQIQNELTLLSGPISKAKLDNQLSNYATIKAKHFY